jgi:hypothetical protein
MAMTAKAYEERVPAEESFTRAVRAQSLIRRNKVWALGTVYLARFGTTRKLLPGIVQTMLPYEQ